MVGGIQQSVRARSAHVAAGFLGGTLALLGSGGIAAAGDEPDADNHLSSAPAFEIAESSEAITPTPSGVLEPIASVSEYEIDGQTDLDGPSLGNGKADSAGSGQAEADLTKDLEPAQFYGALPGLTTRQELFEHWGPPADGDAEAVTVVYELESFPQVVVGFAGDVVDSIDVKLATPRDADELVQKLQLEGIIPVVTEDESGGLAQTSYPERGVTFRHADDEATAFASDDAADAPPVLVYELSVHSIRADQFVERSLRRPAYAYSDRAADLQTAVQLSGNHAVSRVMQSHLMLATGRPAVAERLAAEAVEIDEFDPAYRLQWAKSLTALARYDRAVEQCRKILEDTDTAPLIRAGALHEMGVLASFGSTEVAKRSVPLHNKAIELADAMAGDSDTDTAAAATELLIDAHLAIAAGIAKGEFQEKDKYVGQWIGRASALAEQLIERDQQYLPLRLKVAIGALSAGSRLQPPIDPQLWVAEAEETVSGLEPLASDPVASDEFNWQLGVIYFYATEIQHRRGQAASALRYGELAEIQLAELADRRNELPDAEFLVGRLFFQIGAVHAVHREDHGAACQWYDRATTRLLTPSPVTNLAAPGRHGDALVSMGVSYWHVGQRTRAVELTTSGLDMVQQGVDDGLLAESSLAVPEGNLAAMKRALAKANLVDPAPSARTQVADRPSQTRRR